MTAFTINGRYYSQPVTGVQRYAREIVAALDEALASSADLTDRVEILAPPDTQDIPAYKCISTRKVGRFTGHLWEQLELPLHARGPLLSLANTGPIARRNHVICIHDANTRIIPESYSRAFRIAYRVLHPALGHAAARVMTVSRHAASDLERFRIAPQQHITVAYNGSDHATRWKAAHTPATAAAAGPATIVLLGSRAPHKNMDLILDMAPELAAKGFRVAVVGMSAQVFADGRQTALHPAVTMLGRVSDDALAALLRDSFCLAFPSLTEGFGLPPLEAMTHRCPVIASTAASIPEVCGDAAIFEAPDDPAGWMQAFLKLRDDGPLRRQLIERGLDRARMFRWTDTALLYLSALKQLDTQPGIAAVPKDLHARLLPPQTHAKDPAE